MRLLSLILTTVVNGTLKNVFQEVITDDKEHHTVSLSLESIFYISVF